MTNWKVEIVKPEGPIKWEGFDEHGNFGRIYENGCETWLSKELIEDDLNSGSDSSGTTFSEDVGDDKK